MFCLLLVVLGLKAEPAASPEEYSSRLLAIELAIEALPATGEQADAANRRIGEEFRALLDKFPDQLPVRVSFASWLADSGRNAEARELLVAAGRQVQCDPQALRLLSELSLRLGRIREAAQALRSVVEILPDSPIDHFHLGNILYLFRNDLTPDFGASPPDVLVAAMGQFRTARELAPHSPEMARAYAECFYLLDPPHWEEALDAWQYLRDIEATQSDFANTHIARVALRLGRPQLAREALDAINEPKYSLVKARLLEKVEALEKSEREPAAGH